jgi:hypothetical protein
MRQGKITKISTNLGLVFKHPHHRSHCWWTDAV